MGESIVPWDGMIEDPKFMHELEHAGNGMFLIKGTFSAQSYSCIIDTRNDTWFSLDTVQVQQGADPIDSLNSSGNQSQDEAVSRQVQSPPFRPCKAAEKPDQFFLHILIVRELMKRV